MKKKEWMKKEAVNLIWTLVVHLMLNDGDGGGSGDIWSCLIGIISLNFLQYLVRSDGQLSLSSAAPLIHKQAKFQRAKRLRLKTTSMACAKYGSVLRLSGIQCLCNCERHCPYQLQNKDFFTRGTGETSASFSCEMKDTSIISFSSGQTLRHTFSVLWFDLPTGRPVATPPNLDHQKCLQTSLIVPPREQNFTCWGPLV